MLVKELIGDITTLSKYYHIIALMPYQAKVLQEVEVKIQMVLPSFLELCFQFFETYLPRHIHFLAMLLDRA